MRADKSPPLNVLEIALRQNGFYLYTDTFIGMSSEINHRSYRYSFLPIARHRENDNHGYHRGTLIFPRFCHLSSNRIAFDWLEATASR